jgi:hypothetical protein
MQTRAQFRLVIIGAALFLFLIALDGFIESIILSIEILYDYLTQPSPGNLSIYWSGLISNSILLVFATYLFRHPEFVLDRARLIEPDVCKNCGYPRLGVEGRACPECGEPAPAEEQQ